MSLQRLKSDLMEGFERQLQELIDDFVQEVEEIEQIPACNGPTKSFKSAQQTLSCRLNRLIHSYVETVAN